MSLADIITDTAPWMIKTAMQGEIKSPPVTAADRHHDAEKAIKAFLELAEDVDGIMRGFAVHYATAMPEALTAQDINAISRCVSDAVKDHAIGPLRVALADFREQMEEADDGDRRMEFLAAE